MTSVPDRFLQKWEFNGVERSYSDRFKGHSIFVSHDNADYRDSLQFARLLGQKLKDRGLKYTPHYVEKFMGSRQRILVDADVGVYRYDQLIVLKNNRIPAALLEAGSIINRDEELADGYAEATGDHQRGRGRRHRELLRRLARRRSRTPRNRPPRRRRRSCGPG